MAYFPVGDTPQQDSLPALQGLAREFLICDNWFSSMPGPTWPNRFFIHSGTCLGHIHMPSRKEPQYLYKYDQDTIYDKLNNANKQWCIYHDGIPQSIVMTHLLTEYAGSIFTSKYRGMKGFFEDTKNHEKYFPDYAFIEPCYSGKNENDQHPPVGVASGEQLIASVYNNIRSNDALWKSTLLIIIYDEHGGFFDHVPPPSTVAPDDNTKEFSFDRLGVRVPAILISPWVQKGVCKTLFDHSSILRYLCEKWNMEPISSRTSSEAGNFQSKSFANILTKLSTPRTDTPLTISARSVPKGYIAPNKVNVDGSRESLLYFVASLSEIPAKSSNVKVKSSGVKPSSKLDKLNSLNDKQLTVIPPKKF